MSGGGSGGWGELTPAEQAAAAALAAGLAAIDAEEVSCEGEAGLAARLGELDQVLTWLWRVHGVDYYGGSELLLELPYATRAASSRTMRGPRPEEGEEQESEG